MSTKTTLTNIIAPLSLLCSQAITLIDSKKREEGMIESLLRALQLFKEKKLGIVLPIDIDKEKQAQEIQDLLSSKAGVDWLGEYGIQYVGELFNVDIQMREKTNFDKNLFSHYGISLKKLRPDWHPPYESDELIKNVLKESIGVYTEPSTDPKSLFFKLHAHGIHYVWQLFDHGVWNPGQYRFLQTLLTSLGLDKEGLHAGLDIAWFKKECRTDVSVIKNVAIDSLKRHQNAYENHYYWWDRIYTKLIDQDLPGTKFFYPHCDDCRKARGSYLSEEGPFPEGRYKAARNAACERAEWSDVFIDMILELERRVEESERYYLVKTLNLILQQARKEGNLLDKASFEISNGYIGFWCGLSSEPDYASIPKIAKIIKHIRHYSSYSDAAHEGLVKILMEE